MYMCQKKYVINSLLIAIILITACNSKERNIYYDNGQLKVTSPLKNGKRHGDASFYYENGNLSGECYFENGLRQGVGIYYYPNGIIEQNVFYHNDTIMKSATFREDGTLEVIKEYNAKGQLIEHTCYLDSGQVDSDPSKRYPIFVFDNDTVNQGEIYRTEIRLGNRFYNSIYIYLGDSTDSYFHFQQNIKRIYEDVSLLEIDTDTCELGKNVIFGKIFETCDTCDGSGWATPFKHDFYVMPNPSLTQ